MSTGAGAISGRPVSGEVRTGVGLGEGIADALIDATGAPGLAVGAVLVEALHAATRPTRASAGIMRRAVITPP